LKLRVFESREGELIFYNRENSLNPTCSFYKIVTVEKPTEIYNLLENAYGIRGEIVKTRYLFFIGQTRVHPDKVNNLGDFMELEVVLNKQQNENNGKEIANSIMEQLEISKKDLISNAYIDLLSPLENN